MNDFLSKFLPMITPYLRRNASRKVRVDTFRKRKPVFILFIVCLILFCQFLYMAEQAFGLSFKNREKKEMIAKLETENQSRKERYEKLKAAPFYVECKDVDNNNSE